MTDKTDTWVFLIRESDWDSDAYLPENIGDKDLENDEDMAAHGRFMQAVVDLGARITSSHALQNSKYGGWVDVSGEEPVYTDAPFTDTNEVITGFYAVECDEGTARKLAAMVPSKNVIEWRKVIDFS